MQHIGTDLSQILKELAYKSEHNEEANMKSIGSGLSSLDGIINGFYSSDLIIVGSRPGVEKTSFALNIAVNAARLNKDKKVVIFSLDTQKKQLTRQMLMSEGRISSEELFTGTIKPEKWSCVQETAEMLNSIGLYIDDTENISVEKIKEKLENINDIGLVIVDYLQLLAGRNNSRGFIRSVINLKALADGLNVPVIVLCQLHDENEKRDNKRPVLDDLYSIGDIEQYADVVLFLNRDEYCNSATEQKNSECVVSKNRHGKTGIAYLRWNEKFRRFDSVG